MHGLAHCAHACKADAAGTPAPHASMPGGGPAPQHRLQLPAGAARPLARTPATSRALSHSASAHACRAPASGYPVLRPRRGPAAPRAGGRLPLRHHGPPHGQHYEGGAGRAGRAHARAGRRRRRRPLPLRRGLGLWRGARAGSGCGYLPGLSGAAGFRRACDASRLRVSCSARPRCAAPGPALLAARHASMGATLWPDRAMQRHIARHHAPGAQLPHDNLRRCVMRASADCAACA